MGHAAGAPLLPKLRGQFAEFLDGGSPVHLGMLYQPTCVGLRYGHNRPWLEAFLGRSGSIRAAWGHPRAFPSPLSRLLHRICLAKRPTGLEASRPRTYLPASPHRS